MHVMVIWTPGIRQTRWMRHRAGRLLLILGTLSPAGLWAQSSPTSPTASAGRADTTGAARGDFFTGRDAALAGLFTAGTIAMFPVDRRIAMSLKTSSLQDNAFVHHAADAFRLTAVPGSLLIGGGLYAAGRLSGSARMAELGLHGTEALLIGQALGTAVKGTLGRARPYVVADSNAHDFALGRGFRMGNDFSSLPSGHTIAAFAAASAVTSELAGWWPRATPFVGVVMYGGATMVALERLYDDQHWASDVLLAAAIGTFSGLKVVKFNHEHPGNRVDRLLLSASIAPGANGGATLSWMITP